MRGHRKNFSPPSPHLPHLIQNYYSKILSRIAMKIRSINIEQTNFVELINFSLLPLVNCVKNSCIFCQFSNPNF